MGLAEEIRTVKLRIDWIDENISKVSNSHMAERMKKQKSIYNQQLSQLKGQHERNTEL